MLEKKIEEIRTFCTENANHENVKKYSRYFKEGFEGYGVDLKVFEAQRDQWIEEWKDEMTLNDYLDLGDLVVKNGNYEETSFAISFVKSKREEYTEETFDRLAHWFEIGIANWANTDVLCMIVLSSFMIDKVISFEKLKTWNTAESEWQRRSVPVTLVELIKLDLKPETAIDLVDPLMLDKSEYVQKGIGTLLRGLWRNYPVEIEEFLMKWKDQCGRKIVQYATEKMDKEYRKKFRKSKQK